MASNTVPHSEIPPAQGTANFLERATPYAKLGIPVFPLKPGKKEPIASMTDWPDLASTDLKQIAAWNAENPDYNCGLVAKPDGIVILEFDIAKGMPLAAQEMGQETAKTRVHISGKGFGHHVFLQTDRTRTIGNRSVNLTNVCEDPKCEKAGQAHRHEWFSFRQNNRYVVGPGSIHPNGNEYGVARDVTPLPCPEWVCDFVEKHSVGKAQETKDARPVSEDFDFDELMEHYGLVVINIDGEWHTTDVCPVAGYRHEHSVATGFYWDGDSVGFHCFAQGCEGSSMSIGQVIKFLNQTHEPYRGVIWEEEAIDETQFGVMGDYDADEPVKEQVLANATEAPEEICQAAMFSGCPCKRTHAYRQTSRVDEMKADFVVEDAAGEVGTEESSEAPKPMDAESLFAGLSHEATSLALIENGLTPMPEAAMYGWLGDAARLMDLPLSTAYLALLVSYSALPQVGEILGNFCPLFGALLMPVGGGKNVALNRSVKVLGMQPDLDYMDASIGGVGGLFQCLGDKVEGRGKDKEIIPGHRKMLINPAEFAATLENMKIQNSTLATHLTNLWDKPNISMPVKEGVRSINCRLSILGALPVEKDAPESFTRFFGAETGKGLYSRFLFGFCDQKLDLRWAEEWKYDPPLGADFTSDQVAVGELKGWDTDAREYYSHLKLPYDLDGRGLQNLKRIALLSCMANHDKYVTLDAIMSAEFFMIWQEQLKYHFKHGVAEQTSSGDLSTIVLDTLSRIDKEGVYERSPVIEGRLQIGLARVINKFGWKKYGADAIYRQVKALVDCGQLMYGLKYAEGKPGGEGRKIVASKMHVVVVRF